MTTDEKSTVLTEVLELSPAQQYEFLAELLEIYHTQELKPLIQDSDTTQRMRLIQYLLCNDESMRTELVESANNSVRSLIQSIQSLAQQSALLKIQTTEYAEQENDKKILDELESAFK
jgi:ferritin